MWQPPWAEADAKKKYALEVERYKALYGNGQPLCVLVQDIAARALGMAAVNCLTSKVICILCMCNKRFAYLIKRNRQSLLDGWLLEGYITVLEQRYGFGVST